MPDPTPEIPALVSVITPAYNCAGTLVRAWNSLSAQQGSWESIIVDDGSTDETPSVVDQLAADPRVIAIRQPNGGPGSALNAGIAVAKGAYIAFLDADDEYLPGHLSSRISFLTELPEVDLVWGGVDVLASRPDGHYTVKATHDGKQLTRNITVQHGKQDTGRLEWPQ